uniref:Cytochrome P450 n=1 Tax=Thapsia garganica TaxID=79022 RepID=A0A1U9X602_THAGA|nr:cytochrome P450 [Thapsia garganica]
MAPFYFYLLLALSSLLIFFVHKFLRSEKLLSEHSNPPGPRGLPFIGNLHQLDISNLPNQLWQLSKIYGPVMYLKLGYLPAIVISSPRLAKAVLRTHDLSFCSRPSLFGFKKMSYNCSDVVLSPYGDYWREMRKIVTLHLFSSSRVHSFRSIREEEVFQMIKRISEEGSLGEVTNLTGRIMPLTSTIVCRVAFGKKFDEGYMRKFEGMLHECQAVLANFYFSDNFPLLGWLDTLIGSTARLDKIFKDMDVFYQELIDEHISPSRPSSMEGDVIDILLQLKNGTQSSSIDITLDNIKAILMNIFVAGTETTAGTTIWTMASLIKNPRAMKKVQEEVRKLMNGKDKIDEEDLENTELPYLEAVIKESLRLYPIVPLLIPRESIVDCELEGYKIKAKTIVYVNALAIGRDPQVWENAEEFYPERFLDSEIDFKGQDFEFIPFGAGRRICAGMYMGTTTLKLILSNLLYSFDWELPAGMVKEDVDTQVLPGISMHMKNPLRLVAKKYN